MSWDVPPSGAEEFHRRRLSDGRASTEPKPQQTIPLSRRKICPTKRSHLSPFSDSDAGCRAYKSSQWLAGGEATPSTAQSPSIPN